MLSPRPLLLACATGLDPVRPGTGGAGSGAGTASSTTSSTTGLGGEPSGPSSSTGGATTDSTIVSGAGGRYPRELCGRW